MGASQDITAEGSRRMLVNAAYWALGLEEKIPKDGTKVDIVGEFKPQPFRNNGFKKGVKPSDLLDR
jgi:transposase